MLFSWCVVLFLASYGFSGADSNHVGLQRRGSEEAGGDGFAARSQEDGDGSMDWGTESGEDDNPIDRFKSKELEKKTLSLGFATFIVGGVTALLGLLQRNRPNRKRSDEPAQNADDLKTQVQKKLQSAQSMLNELDDQVRGKQRRSQ